MRAASLYLLHIFKYIYHLIERRCDRIHSFKLFFLRLSKIGYHYSDTACTACRFYTVRAVLKSHALRRLKSQLFAGIKIDVRTGLAVFEHITADYRFKLVINAYLFKLLLSTLDICSGSDRRSVAM